MKTRGSVRGKLCSVPGAVIGSGTAFPSQYRDVDKGQQGPVAFLSRSLIPG